MHHLSHVPSGFSTYTHFFHKLVHQKEKSYPQIFYKKIVFERRFLSPKRADFPKKPKVIHNSTVPITIINNTFYSWIIGFGGAIQIVGGQSQIERFQNFLKEQFL